MFALYFISARLYLLLSAFAIPIASILCWMLVARVRHKRPGAAAGWLVPTAIGQTLTAVAILVLLFVTFVDRTDYGLASVSYILSIVGSIFGGISLWRLWKFVDQLPFDPGNQPPGDPLPPQHGVWAPPPSRPS